MIIIECQQGQEQWQSVRCGIPSASNFDKLVTSKGELSKQWEKYLYTLAGERLIGNKAESWQSEAMKRGTEMEAEARQLYELITGNTVKQIGFAYYDDRKLYGCSPDGLIDPDGLLELKCPTLAIAVEYLLKGKLPTEYFQQVQGQLLCTQRKWVDFMSYYPGLKPFLIRVERDEKFITQLKLSLENFCHELDQVEAKLRSLN